MWKKWAHLAKWVASTGQRGIDLLKRLELTEPLTIDRLRPLRTLYSKRAREEVLEKLSGAQPIRQQLLHACAAANVHQFQDWHWTGAATAGLIDPETGTLFARLCPHLREPSLVPACAGVMSSMHVLCVLSLCLSLLSQWTTL